MPVQFNRTSRPRSSALKFGFTLTQRPPPGRALGPVRPGVKSTTTTSQAVTRFHSSASISVPAARRLTRGKQQRRPPRSALTAQLLADNQGRDAMDRGRDCSRRAGIADAGPGIVSCVAGPDGSRGIARRQKRWSRTVDWLLSSAAASRALRSSASDADDERSGARRLVRRRRGGRLLRRQAIAGSAASLRRKQSCKTGGHCSRLAGGSAKVKSGSARSP
jgi:hypothetical protein